VAARLTQADFADKNSLRQDQLNDEQVPAALPAAHVGHDSGLPCFSNPVETIVVDNVACKCCSQIEVVPARKREISCKTYCDSRTPLLLYAKSAINMACSRAEPKALQFLRLLNSSQRTDAESLFEMMAESAFACRDYDSFLLLKRNLDQTLRRARGFPIQTGKPCSSIFQDESESVDG